MIINNNMPGTKHLVFQLAYRLRGSHLIKAINNVMRKKVTIVTYHRVTDRKVDQIEDAMRNLFVNVETFEKQILFFKKNYTIVGLSALNKMAGDEKLPSNLMLVTFDDGYFDFYQHAYPVLKKYGIPSVLFIVPGKIGCTDDFSFWWDELFCYMTYMRDHEVNGVLSRMPDDVRSLFGQFKDAPKPLFDRIMESFPELEIVNIINKIRSFLGDEVRASPGFNSMLTWENVRDMSDIVEIGSHTMNHRNMRHLSENELYEEIHNSKREIQEKTRKEVIAFSYPNGYYNQRIVRHVREAGYRFAFTTDKGINDLSDLFLLKRINIWENTSSVISKPFSEGKLGLKVAGL
jgi:peptidoglycan/xylan/chitin deacetylase (PgdA/CDA1 family)